MCCVPILFLFFFFFFFLILFCILWFSHDLAMALYNLSFDIRHFITPLIFFLYFHQCECLVNNERQTLFFYFITSILPLFSTLLEYPWCFVATGLVWFIVFKCTFNNISVISWWSVLLVEKTGENHWPVASNWQTLSYNVVSSTPRHERDSELIT